MSDRIKETLSALMDDEATELEVRRVLMHDDQETVQATWYRYQQVRAVMRDEEDDWSTVDLLDGINAALEGEADAEAESVAEPAGRQMPMPASEVRPMPVEKAVSAHYRWSVGAAVAAMLVAAIWVVRPDTGSAPANQVASVSGPPARALEEHLMKHLQYAAMNTGQLVAYARLNAFDVQGE